MSTCNSDFTLYNIPVNSPNTTTGETFNDKYVNSDNTVDVCVIQQCKDKSPPLNMYAINTADQYDVNADNSLIGNASFKCYDEPINNINLN